MGALYSRQWLAVIASGLAHLMLPGGGHEACELWLVVIVGFFGFLLKAVEDSPAAFSGVGRRWHQSDGCHHNDSQ